jgi:hypothetical protein
MTRHDTGEIAAVAELRAALERLADALAQPRLDALLAGESAIEAALARVPSVAVVAPESRGQLQREIEHARHMLMRCRRLGAALTDFVRVSFEAQGRGPAYGPRAGSAPTYNGSALNTRV